MKQLIYIAFFCLVTLITKAQIPDKISFTTTIGTGIPMSSPSKVPVNWQVIGYYQLSDRWLAGAGMGLSFYEKILIPLYGDIRFQIGRTRRFTPFAELAAGYSFAPQSNVNGGFFMNPSFGVQYPLTRKIKLQLAIGYELQELERLKSQMDDIFLKEFSEQLSHHSLSIKVGLRF